MRDQSVPAPPCPTAPPPPVPAGVVERLRRRLSLAREAAMFLGVGLAAYIVDLSVFNLAFYGWHQSLLAAKILAMVISATVAFAGNRCWTWRHRARNSLQREYSLFFVFNAIGLGITLLWVAGYEIANAWWPTIFDNPLALNIVVNFFGVGAASLFRFWAYRTWVFTTRTSG